MASRSAMARSLIVAAVMLAVVHSASAANNGFFNKVTIQLQGAASDYLQVAKRNQFCAAFGPLLTTGTATLPNDLNGCAIESAVNGGTNGEVTVTAAFAFAANRADAAAGVVSPITTALNNAAVTGFVKATSAGSSPVAALTGNALGVFPQYFLEVEIVTTAVVTEANYQAALTTALAGATTPVVAVVTCTAPTPVGTNSASKLVCRLTSRTKTRAEMLTAVETLVKTGFAVPANGATVTALYARDTNVQVPAFNNAGNAATQYELKVGTVFSGTTAADLTTNTPALRTALFGVLGNAVADATNDIAIGTPGTVTGTGASSEITIKVATEASVNRILELLKQTVGSTFGSSTVNFTLNSVTSIKADPPIFSGISDTVYPGTANRFSIAVANTTSAFTTAPYQFRRVCESITSTLQGNATTCSIVDFNRPSGDTGTVIVDITAANTSAALGFYRSVVRAVAAVPVTTFALGAVTEVFPTPPTIVTGSVAFTVNLAMDAITAAVRTDICNSLTTAPSVPGPNLINCFISDTDVAAGTPATSSVVTARVWWNLIDYTVEEYVKALLQAKTSSAFPTTGTNLNTVVTSNPAFAVGSATTNFAFDIDFHITTALADFTAVQAAFALAVKAIVGANAAVTVIRSVAATALTPATGSVVTVRVFTATAVAQAAAFSALAPQVAGTNTTLTTSGSTTTFTIQSAGFRRVTFTPPLAVSEFPAVPAPPPPATPPARPATPPATPPPGLPPQVPITVGTDPNRDANSASATFIFEFAGSGTEAQFNNNIDQLKAGVNAAAPGTVVSHTTTGFSSFGKKFVVQNYRGTVTFLTSSPAAAATLNTRIATAIANGAIPNARVVSVTPASNPAVPATPAAPTAPTAPAAPVAMTSGTIDIVILGTRSSFTATDQTALTSNVGSAINGTASVVGVTETSTNARKFTMQASALRVATVVSAPTAQYPTLDSIIARLLAVRTTQNGRLGNSSVFSITAATGSSAARSGPIALTILVALLVAMLSAMAQF